MGGERRRNRRYDCRGGAQIITLPWEGELLLGRLRNLGLGGCYVETDSDLHCGDQAEILLRLNHMVVRTVGQVRAIREHAGLCLEFTRMSTGARGLLLELLGELERAQRAGRSPRAVSARKLREAMAEMRVPMRLEEVPVVGEPRPAEGSKAAGVIVQPEVDVFA